MAKSFNRFPELKARMKRNTSLQVDAALEAVEQGARLRSRRLTGHLFGSWKSQKTGVTEGVVYSDDFKSVWHEYSTVKMGAQPMATPSAEAYRARFARSFRRML